jgi:hypothetical protein
MAVLDGKILSNWAPQKQFCIWHGPFSHSVPSGRTEPTAGASKRVAPPVIGCIVFDVSSHACNNSVPAIFSGEQPTHPIEGHTVALLRATACLPALLDLYLALASPFPPRDTSSPLPLHSLLRPPTTHFLASTPWPSALTGTQRRPIYFGRCYLHNDYTSLVRILQNLFGNAMNQTGPKYATDISDGTVKIWHI